MTKRCSSRGALGVLFAARILIGCAGVEPPHVVDDAGASDHIDLVPASDASRPRLDANPGRETCNNGLDDDGNGRVDDGCTCSSGATEKCFVGDRAQAGVGACTFGTQTCATSGSGDIQVAEWGACTGEGAPTPEVCNGIDDDCDGKIDDITQPCSNACGAGKQTCTNGTWSACSARTPTKEVCNGIDDDCDGKIDDITQPCSNACGAGTQTCTNGVWSACSARMPTKEVCNGVDDDCDGRVDDITQSCSSACGTGTETCSNGEWSACSAKQPSPEVCNGIDDDCNGKIDDGLEATWTFENQCGSSEIFVVIGGCNVCEQTCTGTWVTAGSSYSTKIAQNTCFEVSAFARTPSGDVCLVDSAPGSYVGEIRTLCNGDCHPQTEPMVVYTGC
jgi:Putative metal-binding motif